MINLSYKNRVSLWFLLATALITLLAFLGIFYTVKFTIYQNIDNDLSFEIQKHKAEVFIENGEAKFKFGGEWMEREHNEVQVNPLFLQVVDSMGKVLIKSPNLYSDSLTLNTKSENLRKFNSKLNTKTIRQVQIPIISSDSTQIKGYTILAMSLESSINLLENLSSVLKFLFPICLGVLFFTTRFLAGRSISPINRIIKTANRIKQENINERIDYPETKDELFKLIDSINNMLDRIEASMQREKQFTSDASHELRTPLSIIKGQLEVLIRKPREPKEYISEIQKSLKVVDRMALIFEQLLILARFDKEEIDDKSIEFELCNSILEVLEVQKSEIDNKNIKIILDFDDEIYHNSSKYYFEIAIGNIISNAIKYSNSNSSISITLTVKENIIIEVVDNGIGIESEDLENIKMPFFRSNYLKHKDIKGVGLGLSIVSKICNVFGWKIDIQSTIGKGTKVKLILS